MTNRLTPTAKTLLAAALAATAVLGLSACSSATKPAAATGAASTNPATTPAVGTPIANQGQPNQSQPTNQSQPAADNTATTGPAQGQNQNQTPSTAAATKTQPTTSKAPATNPSKSTDGSNPTLADACTPENLKATVTTVNRPINHLLLTATNTGTTTCSVYYYPDLRLDADQQSVTQANEDSKPQAVVTIQPGESAYAGIGTSAADGSGGKPQLEKQVEVFLETSDQSGSLPGELKLPLPAGTYVDVDKAFVTYWQDDLQSALAW